jgi:hypothetical protein
LIHHSVFCSVVLYILLSVKEESDGEESEEEGTVAAGRQ